MRIQEAKNLFWTAIPLVVYGVLVGYSSTSVVVLGIALPIVGALVCGMALVATRSWESGKEFFYAGVILAIFEAILLRAGVFPIAR